MIIFFRDPETHAEEILFKPREIPAIPKVEPFFKEVGQQVVQVIGLAPLA